MENSALLDSTVQHEQHFAPAVLGPLDKKTVNKENTCLMSSSVSLDLNLNKQIEEHIR